MWLGFYVGFMHLRMIATSRRRDFQMERGRSPKNDSLRRVLPEPIPLMCRHRSGVRKTKDYLLLGPSRTWLAFPIDFTFYIHYRICRNKTYMAFAAFEMIQFFFLSTFFFFSTLLAVVCLCGRSGAILWRTLCCGSGGDRSVMIAYVAHVRHVVVVVVGCEFKEIRDWLVCLPPPQYITL